MSPAVLIGEKCPYCTKFRSPLDFLRLGPGGVKFCAECWRRHNEALEALSTGTFTGRCSECDKTPEQLRSPTGAMAVHFENGLYRAMCAECDRTYVPKRRELYGDTEFGHQLKLK